MKNTHKIEVLRNISVMLYRLKLVDAKYAVNHNLRYDFINKDFNEKFKSMRGLATLLYYIELDAQWMTNRFIYKHTERRHDVRGK